MSNTPNEPIRVLWYFYYDSYDINVFRADTPENESGAIIEVFNIMDQQAKCFEGLEDTEVSIQYPQGHVTGCLCTTCVNVAAVLSNKAATESAAKNRLYRLTRARAGDHEAALSMLNEIDLGSHFQFGFTFADVAINKNYSPEPLYSSMNPCRTVLVSEHGTAKVKNHDEPPYILKHESLQKALDNLSYKNCMVREVDYGDFWDCEVLRPKDGHVWFKDSVRVVRVVESPVCKKHKDPNSRFKK